MFLGVVYLKQIQIYYLSYYFWYIEQVVIGEP